jgi:hypothetical protein
MSIQEELLKEFPSVKIEAKASSRFWRLLGWLVRVVTLGSNTAFMTNQITTVGTRIGVTPDWERMSQDARDTILAHERVHLRQQRWCGLGSVWLGLLPWAVTYLLLPFPVFVAYGRYALERAAYLETLKQDPSQFDMVVEVLSGSDYFYAWLWPDHTAVWLRKRLSKPLT